MDGLAFFESYAALDGVLDNLASGNIKTEELVWLYNGNDIYFIVDWYNETGVAITKFYTPEEALQNVWKELGLYA